MDLEVTGEVWYWRGPAPFHFVSLPADEAARLGAVANLVTYGWGCIPATVRVGATTYTTSLFPKDGGFAVPVKVAVRRAEGIDLGDVVSMRVTVPDP
ncbi:DUF1905 domain-containing protein [Luteimicrobium subarcticum]|uniref:Uncharacterized protein DUF1905 n=1 Tax=Luteimicrobium subarcticum TaxID=620910 RepID=A0A2M8W1L8_9MICO|nr:DUF1905 domain-containing protein [Luteimicrobium subarcticum]PJI84823.1 uncharacterized protein DUF1905 [Luteimicrobium subarcticum]